MTTKITTNLGLITYFRAADVWVRPSDAHASMAAENIPGSIPDLAKRGVTRASFAASHWRRQHERADIIERTDCSIKIGLLRRAKRQVGGANEIGWFQYDSVTWEEGVGWSGATTAEGVAFYSYGTKWQTWLDYHWVRSIVFGMLNSIGIPMGGGGILYVPGDRMAEFDRLNRWVQTMPGAMLYAIKIDPTDDGSRGAVGDAVTSHALNQVEDVIARLGEWREKAKGRTSTLEKMLGELGDVRGRAIALSEALRFSTDSVEAAIVAAEEELRKTLDEAIPVEPVTETPVVSAATESTPVAETVLEVLQEQVVEPDPETSPETVIRLIPSVEVLENCSSRELRKIAAKIGLKGYSKLDDVTLVSRILARREDLVSAA